MTAHVNAGRNFFDIGKIQTQIVRAVPLSIVVDSSSSNADFVDYFMREGFVDVLESLEAVERTEPYRFHVTLCLFSTIHKFVFENATLSEIRAKMGQVQGIRHGVTRVEVALEETYEKMRSFKSQIKDEPHTRGTILVISDGQPTDENGSVIPLSAKMVRMLESLNKDQHEPNIAALGTGTVHFATLKQLGGGNAFLFNNQDQQATMKAIVGLACELSSSSAVGGIAEGYKAFEGYSDVALMPELYEVVA